VAERCGGCDLQGAGGHAATLKLAMVDDLLHRQLPAAPVREWHPAPAGTRRHRIQLHWDGKKLGFHRRGSHDIIEVRDCPAAEAVLSAAIPRLLDALEAQVLPSRPQRWQLATGTPAAGVWASDEKERTWQLEPDGWKRSEDPVFHGAAGIRLGHGPGGFFQVCAPRAMEAFGSVLAGWDLRGETLYDLYGGVGLFSALLGDRFRRRVLVESGAEACAWARRNLEGLEAEFHCAEVAEWLPEGVGNPPDVLLLDPPRTGLGLELCARLQEAGAGTLVLVGCDGASFCRDVNALAPAWTLAQLAVLDLFPLTVHAEFVGLMKKA
jgi:23S rRNA (uracil1939-C5)-methyltransferase